MTGSLMYSNYDTRICVKGPLLTFYLSEPSITVATRTVKGVCVLYVCVCSNSQLICGYTVKKNQLGCTSCLYTPFPCLYVAFLNVHISI